MTDCTVVIPIGPGHMELAQTAMASVVAAVEAGKGPFEQVFVVCGDDTKGQFVDEPEVGGGLRRDQVESKGPDEGTNGEIAGDLRQPDGGEPDADLVRGKAHHPEAKDEDQGVGHGGDCTLRDRGERRPERGFEWSSIGVGSR